MISYPKIPSTRGFKHSQCVAFDKLDGTNVGAEWTPKRGFHKFRLRSRLFDRSDPHFGPAIDIFLKATEPLNKLFAEHSKFKNDARVTVFGEFYGPSTFAGNHFNLPPNEIRMVSIFDCWKDKFGFIGPNDFISLFSDLVPIAKPIYQGKFTGKLVDDVRNGKFNICEGVIIKAGRGGDDIEYAKVKTNKYMEKLKLIFGKEWESHWE